MIFTQLLSVVLTALVDHLIHTSLGALFLVCLALVGIGLRLRDPACVSVGTVLFLLLMAQA
ncbi:hypothetical protein [Streptomyces sp. NPDC005876]|jgi:hypothetical protein|uniref:hypothetical protein n=1 Tax=unclassified Streptomyces TaxID=2593676 RepID=UPI0033E77530